MVLVVVLVVLVVLVWRLVRGLHSKQEKVVEVRRSAAL